RRCPSSSPKATPTPAWSRPEPMRPRKPKMRPERAAIAVFALALSAAAAAQSLPPGLLEKARALPAPTGAELQRHADALAAMTPAERAAFEKRVAQWDARLPAEQRERREAWQAWRALPEAERGQLRAAAKAYS